MKKFIKASLFVLLIPYFINFSLGEAQANGAVPLPVMSRQYGGSSDAEAGNASLGFKFIPPEGWISQTTAEGVLLGHNTVAGLILVIPHQAQSVALMQQEMREGMQDEGTYLMLSGEITSLNDNALIADYEGYADGTSVKGKGIGVVSPDGGGAYIIAVTTPEMLGNDLINAAKTIAGNLHFVKMETSDLMNYFSGKWSTFTTNTSTDIYLYPNGVYSEYYESSYSGTFQDGGVSSGSWGAGGQSNDSGRWSVQGTRDSGTLTIITPDGERQVVEYHVHIENGQTYYNEYWFNGSLYSKTALGY